MELHVEFHCVIQFFKGEMKKRAKHIGHLKNFLGSQGGLGKSLLWCLCAMFGFHPKIVHVSKDDAYDANNNVIKSIY
jgi:hypothetical protein